MDWMIGLGTIWAAAAAVFTFGVARAGATASPFHVEARPLSRSGR